MESITLFCHGCKTDKPVSEFYKRSDTKRGYRIKCEDCMAKEYQAKKNKNLKTSNIHDLANKSLYPLYYRYVTDRSILNIYSTLSIEKGQKLILDGTVYKIEKIRKRFDSDPKNCRFKEVIFYYDEVKIIKAS